MFRYAIANGRAQRDPSADLRDALTPLRSQHRAAVTHPEQVGELLDAIDGFNGTFVVKSAPQLAPLVFVRPGELRRSEWSEVHLEAASWCIPAERLKMREAHIATLSTQAVASLQELKPWPSTHGTRFRPSAPSRGR